MNDKPFVLFGHSFGGMVAAMTAAELVHQDLCDNLMMLGISGCPAERDPASPLVHKLENDAFIEYIMDLGGVDDIFLKHRDMLEAQIPLLRADFRILEEAPLEQVRVPCAISVIYGANDKLINDATANKWKDYTEDTCRVRVLPGKGHFYLDEPEIRQQVWNEVEAIFSLF